MKRFTTKSLVLAAAFAAVAVGASAQTLSAEIPFNFRMGDAAMAPGAYQFNIGYGSSGVARIQMTSIETKKSVLVLPQSRRDAAKAWIAAGVPKLAFSCAEGNCALTGPALTAQPSCSPHPAARITTPPKFVSSL